jgi:hypothetical protein
VGAVCACALHPTVFSGATAINFPLCLDVYWFMRYVLMVLSRAAQALAPRVDYCDLDFTIE